MAIEAYIILAGIFVGPLLYHFLGLTLTLGSLGIIALLATRFAINTSNRALLWIGRSLQQFSLAKPDNSQIKVALATARVFLAEDERLSQECSDNSLTFSVGLLSYICSLSSPSDSGS
jgi:hypothetical protein